MFSTLHQTWPLFGPVCSGCWEVCITAAAVRLDYKECGRHTRCLAAYLMEVIPFLAVFIENLELSLADWQGLGGWDKLGATIFCVFQCVSWLGPLPFAPPMGCILCVVLAGRLVFGGLFLGGCFKNCPSCPCLPEPTSSFVACFVSAKQRVSQRSS